MILGRVYLVVNLALQICTIEAALGYEVVVELTPSNVQTKQTLVFGYRRSSVKKVSCNLGLIRPPPGNFNKNCRIVDHFLTKFNLLEINRVSDLHRVSSLSTVNIILIF